MASRRKQKGKRAQKGQLFQQAQREYEKRNYKQALKDAKVCYRQDPAEPHRQLLEKTLCARGMELMKMGLTPQAREVAEDLLELGLTEPETKTQSAELFYSLGIQSPKAPALPAEAEANILPKMADRAVVKPQTASSTRPEIHQGAKTIRHALKTLEEGDESEALALLKDIPRNSPFADWRLFVRGLAAYYRGDNLDMQANWDRLDPERAAADIARPLRALAEADQALVPEADRKFVGRLERSTLQTALYSNLEELQRLMVEEDAGGVLRHLRANSVAFRKLDADLKARIVPILIQWGIRYLSESGFRELTRLLEPLPIDPHWHRAWAFYWEEEEDEPELIEEAWRKYLDDLPRLKSLSPEEQRLAESLVCLRVAGMLVMEIEQYRDSPWDNVSEDLEELAEEYFSSSIETTPTLSEAYRQFSAALKLWDQSERSLETLEQLLKHVPDDVDAIMEVGNHHLHSGDPFRGRELILKARELRPLDHEVQWMTWAAHLRVGREEAQLKHWDAGRQAFAEAEKLDPDGERRMQWSCRKAVFEIKAGQVEQGQKLAEEAQNLQQEAAPALLLLMMEAARYGLDESWREQWTNAFDAALKRRINTAAAGTMCEQLTANILANAQYAGREHQIQGLLKYVSRSTRYKYQPEELRWVCDFLLQMEEPKLLQKMVRKGRKAWPDFPYFHLLAGKEEMEKGPFRCDRRKATKAFEQALAAAESSDHPEAKDWADSARQALTLLRDFPSDLPGFFQGGSGPGPMPAEMQEMFARIIEDIDSGELDDLFGAEEDEDESSSRGKKSRKKPKRKR